MTSINRRSFLRNGALAGAALAVPSASRAAHTPATDDKVIGTSKWDLNTPALCVDLDKLEKNIRTAADKLKGTGVGIRPHVKTHKCPAIAKMQLKAGGIGICTAKLGETQVMLENGISQVLMTGVNITSPKIKLAMQLRKKFPGFIQAVDNPQNAKDLNDAAGALGIRADVVVDINVINRSGIPTGQPALELAQLVDKLPNLKFRGILAYDGMNQHVKGFQNRRTALLKNFEGVVESYNLMKKAGLNLEIFSGGGTGSYNIMGEVKGFTDVQIGSYVFMDRQYLAIGSATNDQVYDDFESSLTVLTTVINTNFPGRLTTDAGSKALTLNKPNPYVIGEPDFDYAAGSDEYGMITYTKANKSYRNGDKLDLIIPHCDPAVNEHDIMYGIRNDKVESVLPILARGKGQ